MLFLLWEKWLIARGNGQDLGMKVEMGKLMWRSYGDGVRSSGSQSMFGLVWMMSKLWRVGDKRFQTSPRSATRLTVNLEPLEPSSLILGNAIPWETSQVQ